MRVYPDVPWLSMILQGRGQHPKFDLSIVQFRGILYLEIKAQESRCRGFLKGKDCFRNRIAILWEPWQLCSMIFCWVWMADDVYRYTLHSGQYQTVVLQWRNGRRCLGTFFFFHSFQWLRSCEVKGMSPYLEITILRHTHKTQWGFCVTGPIVIIIAFFGGGGRKEAKLSFRLFHFTSKHWRALIPHPPKRGWIIREFWTCIFCLPCLPWLRSDSWILRILKIFSSPALIFHRIPSSGHVFF